MNARTQADRTEDARTPLSSRGNDRVLLGAQVAEGITDYIRREGLSAGDPLPSEAVLAGEYKVSQRVVRDALRLLGQQGVLRTQQGKRAVVSDLRPVAVHGYFKLVTGMDKHAIGELLELRQALETKAAGLAASRIDSRRLAELDDILRKTTECGDDLAARVDLDLAFHQMIVDTSENRFFTAIHEALAEVLASERRRGAALTESAGGHHEESDAEHRTIMYALSSADPLLAEQAMRTHLERVARRYEQAG